MPRSGPTNGAIEGFKRDFPVGANCLSLSLNRQGSKSAKWVMAEDGSHPAWQTSNRRVSSCCRRPIDTDCADRCCAAAILSATSEVSRGLGVGETSGLLWRSACPESVGHYADAVGVGPKQKLSSVAVVPDTIPPLVVKCELNRMHVETPPPGPYFQWSHVVRPVRVATSPLGVPVVTGSLSVAVSNSEQGPNNF